MTDKELEEWVNRNPMIAHAVLPTLIVFGALLLQVASIGLVSWMLYVHSF